MRRRGGKPNRGGGRFNKPRGGSGGGTGGGQGSNASSSSSSSGSSTSTSSSSSSSTSSSFSTPARLVSRTGGVAVKMSSENQDLVHSLLRDIHQGTSSPAQIAPPQTKVSSDLPYENDDEEEPEIEVPKGKEELFDSLLEMGFAERDIANALQVVDDKEAALDWLCLHVDEASLPKKIAPILSTRDEKVRLKFINQTNAGESFQQELAITRLILTGFPREDCIEALQQNSGDEELALRALLRRFVSDEQRASTPEPTLSEEEIQTMREEELLVLESIFAQDFEQRTKDAWHIKLTLESVPGENVLEVYLEKCRYPLEPPYLLLNNDKLLPRVRFEVNKALAIESWSHLGEPMIYNIVTWLQEQMPQIVTTVQTAIEEKQKRADKKRALKEEQENAARAASEPSATANSRAPAMDRTLKKLEEDKDKAMQEEEMRAARIALLQKMLEMDQNPQLREQQQQPAAPVEQESEDLKEIDAAIEKTKSSDGDKALKVKVIPPRYRNSSSGETKAMDEESKHKELKQKEQLGKTLLENFLRHQRENQAYKEMQVARARLPAYQMKETILQAVKSNQVIVISGETGCGKTTQTPQFILDDLLTSGRGGFCNMICTQPRRISASSVAERVAEERAEPIGRTVGWQIRLEARRSQETRLLFCTTGVLLRRLQTDKALDGISHIIVDEIHERDLNSDFLLIILRELVTARKDLKLILMSATLNAELFSGYFGKAPIIHIPGFTHPVKEYWLEDVIELTGYVLDANSPYAKQDDNKCSGPKAKGGRVGKKRGGAERGNEYLMSGQMTKKKETKRKKDFSDLVDELYKDYSATTKASLEKAKEEEINYELLEELVWKICNSYEQGGILIFLPGMMEITTLYDQLLADRRMQDRSKFLLLALHSSLSTEMQHLVFNRPKPGVRKIVIATNIAETSITIDDIVFVINSGRVKEKRYDPLNKLSCLIECWIAKANKRQRRGRAGRVQPGHCFHLFTKWREETKMRDFQVPEILRVPLDELALQIRLLQLGKVGEFLSKAIEPPTDTSINTSLLNLRELNAIDEDEDLTPLGYHLATLPVEPRIGKMMIFGSVFHCVDPVLTIAASMSFRSPFVAPIDKRNEADLARRKFAQNLDSDHLTLLLAFRGFEESLKQNREREYCRNNFLSLSTVKMIVDLKDQFLVLLKDIGFVTAGSAKLDQPSEKRKGKRRQKGEATEVDPVYNENSLNLQLIKSILCAGLYPNVIRVEKASQIKPAEDGKGKPKGNANTIAHFYTKKREQVFLHPSSTLFSLPVFNERWLIYHEKVKTTKVYIRDGTLITPYPLLLFGGEIAVHHEHQVVEVDQWIAFNSPAKVAVLMKQLRRELDKLLLAKIEDPLTNLSDIGRSVIDTIVTLITSERDMRPQRPTDAK